jgi:hypothetical protein
VRARRRPHDRRNPGLAQQPAHPDGLAADQGQRIVGVLFQDHVHPARPPRMRRRVVLSLHGREAAVHAGQVVDHEVPVDADDRSEGRAVLHPDVHRAVAAHREARDDPERGRAGMRALDGWDDGVEHPVHHLVIAAGGVRPLGIGVVLAIAIGTRDDEWLVSEPQPLVEDGGQPAGERLRCVARVSVQQVHDRDARRIGTRRPPHPDRVLGHVGRPAHLQHRDGTGQRGEIPGIGRVEPGHAGRDDHQHAEDEDDREAVHLGRGTPPRTSSSRRSGGRWHQDRPGSPGFPCRRR